MKKKGIILGIITAALAIGSITFASLINKNAQPTELEAEAYNMKTSVQNGFFTKVTNANNIAGEDLLLVGDGWHTFQHLVGASYHYWVTTEYGGVTASFGDAVYCNNAKGELVTLEDDGDPNTTNVYYLKLKHYVDNAHDGYHKVKSGYIVHEAYNNNGVTAFGDLYIRDKKNQPSKAAATWVVEYGQNSGTMSIKSCLDGRPLFWKPGSNYNWSSFACSTNISLGSNINLYRRVTDTSTIIITATQHSDKEYYFGEKTDLTGLEITVNVNNAATITDSYGLHPESFKALNVSFRPQLGHFEWCGPPGQYGATVKHDDRDMRTYNKATSTIKDLRGSYVLGFQNAQGFVRLLDVKSLDNNHGAIVQPVRNTLPVTDWVIVAQDAALDYRDDDVFYNEVQIVLEPIQEFEPEKFVIKTKTNEYISPSPDGVIKGPKDASCEIVVNDDNHVLFDGSFGSLLLVFDSRTSCDDDDITADHLQKVVAVPTASVQSYHIPIELYKLQFTPNLKFAETLDEFKSLFFEHMTKFDRTLVTRNVSYNDDWAVIKEAYLELPLDLQSYLTCLTYNHNHEEPQTIEDMIDIYDMIYGSYYDVGNGFDDFMHRKEAGSLVRERKVTLNGTNCTISGEPSATYNAAYTATIGIASDYVYPQFVEVLMGGIPLEEGEDAQYTYDSETGVIEIKGKVVVDDITINVVAEFVGFTVTYFPGDGYTSPNSDSSTNPNKSGVAKNTVVELISFAESGFIAPKWQHFKAWKIGDAEYAPGAEITVTGDLAINAVYEYDNPAIGDIEKNVGTTAYLSFNGQEDGEGGYTFDDVSIRFGGFITETAWTNLTSSTTVLGFGVMISTENYLEESSIQDIYRATREDHTVNEAISIITQGNYIKNYYAAGTPDSANDAQKVKMGLDEEQNYYVFNLYQRISERNFAINFAAAAYILTSDDIIFLGENRSSVKSLALQELNNQGENPDPALSALVNKYNWRENNEQEI